MIHPTAIVSKNSKVHDSSEIGPFCIIDDNVEIGENNRLISHVSAVIQKYLTIILLFLL